MNIKKYDWRYNKEQNKIIARDSGNCPVTIVEGVFGSNEEERNDIGKLISLAPLMLELVDMVLATATIETPEHVVEVAKIINNLAGNSIAGTETP